MEKIELGSNLPWGLCPDCLDRMRAGDAYDSVKLPAAELIHAYCAHREAGATLLIRPDAPLRWRILTPIEAIEWKQYLALQLPMYAGALKAIADIAAAAPPPDQRGEIH